MFKSYLKPDLEVEVYKNYQTSDKVIATAKLTEFYREGEKFIINDDMADHKITVFGTQLWRCIILKSEYYPEGMTKILPFKYIYNQGGIPPSKTKYENEDEIQFAINDNFLVVNGVELF
mgnify:FL=1